jgi:hypothetical protein
VEEAADLLEGVQLGAALLEAADEQPPPPEDGDGERLGKREPERVFGTGRAVLCDLLL